ncbi:hypothetical protein TanjilG_16465 [Lupinus angustifolius]|uniref:Uncharacterized protein n=1 Tax=Lupinus angustifolius TaxID=3871 RepID=A0A1J7GSC7_LUPAN|nr:hypothetical protein TanjilG_16465 [Lupinus angustifolius]
MSGASTQTFGTTQGAVTGCPGRRADFTSSSPLEEAFGYPHIQLDWFNSAPSWLCGKTWQSYAEESATTVATPTAMDDSACL